MTPTTEEPLAPTATVAASGLTIGGAHVYAAWGSIGLAAAAVGTAAASGGALWLHQHTRSRSRSRSRSRAPTRGAPHRNERPRRSHRSGERGAPLRCRGTSGLRAHGCRWRESGATLGTLGRPQRGNLRSSATLHRRGTGPHRPHTRPARAVGGT